MYVQKYYCGRDVRRALLDAIDDVNKEFGRTVLRYGCGLYTPGQPQEITVVGETEEFVRYLHEKIWG